jgi:hypothetical protein
MHHAAVGTYACNRQARGLAPAFAAVSNPVGGRRVAFRRGLESKKGAGSNAGIIIEEACGWIELDGEFNLPHLLLGTAFVSSGGALSA